MNFLHNFLPQPILVQWGFITIRFYGLLIAVAVVACFGVVLYLSRRRGIDRDDLYDLALWLILGGIIGARLYDVFLIDWNYFVSNPWQIIQIWHGGLAVHGAIIGGVMALLAWCKVKRKSFWQFAGLIFTVLPLGQAIGRWGNYFNSELFGRPTTLPWGIPISTVNRPEQYSNFQYFQPAFLYESILNLILFFVLLFLYKKYRRPSEIVIYYLMGYSAIRFMMEFIRIDVTSLIFGIRLPQLVSVAVFVICAVILILKKIRKL